MTVQGSDVENIGASQSTWRPTVFRFWVPLSAALFCWALIIILQLLLVESEKHGGIHFTRDPEDLPHGPKFLYFHLPIIVAILFSIFWSWVDLQVMRLEPYHQLSKVGGALGKHSLLLQYPFDFSPFVPAFAARDG